MKTPVTNLTFLKSFTGGNNEKMAKYINMFLQLAPGIVANMDLHLQNSEWSLLKSVAHSLKPQVGYMGMKEAEELIKTIENNAAELINLDKVPEQIQEFKKIFSVAQQELNDTLAGF
jgi:HPt (histidine-containing phosphotransfer) domain-containing protein